MVTIIILMSVFDSLLKNMSRFIFLAVFAVAASAGDIDVEKCRDTIHPGLLHCCKTVPFDKAMDTDVKECHEVAKDPSSCDRELCLATKKGIVTADGEIDKGKLEEIMVNEFEDQPEVLEAIKSYCIYGDLDAFGPPEFCIFVKLRNCLVLQYVTKCPEWNNEGACEGTKESVEECSEFVLLL